jgi:hypothetical protein
VKDKQGGKWMMDEAYVGGIKVCQDMTVYSRSQT